MLRSLRHPPRGLAAALLTASLVLPLAPSAGAGPATPAERTTTRKIARTAWATDDQLRTGALAGVVVRRGALVIDEPTGHRSFAGRRYEVARWTSPWTAPGFDLTELIASWEATTPGRSFIEVQVRGRAPSGKRSTWDTLGRWAATDKYVRRTSVGGQGDDLAKVNVDTWQTASSTGLSAWQLRVTLLRTEGAPSPRVDTIGAMASRLPRVSGVATSTPGPGNGITLDVPRYSQMVHRGHYPRWGGGGQAWCSPTSTSMVLGYYDALPSAAEYGWVSDGHTQPWVDHAARMTYDHAYEGTGNWPFNTAYAATHTSGAFVTRLRNLREAGLFIEAGIPLVASVTFGPGELDNAPISSTNGHLLVIVGFTDRGNVVVNDPAARRASGVRRVYKRGQFEDVWLPRSGGLVYVIRDGVHPLPDTPHTNF